MPFVRLQETSKIALLALSVTVGACASEESPAPITERNLTSTPLPPSEDDGSSPSGDSPAPGVTPEAPAGDDDAPASPVIEDLRGTNLVGMEGGYGFDAESGPVPDREYAVHSNRIVDYLAAKKVKVLRVLFSWERMQSKLGGPVPAAASGNYKTYFDNYKRIVDYATSKGMSVVMAPWQAGPSGGTGGARWRGNLVGGSTVTNAHFADFWSKMASAYADNPRVAIGLVNEPNSMSTMTWFAAAQAAITAIREAKFSGAIYVPGNGWTGAGSWTGSGYDTASPKRSNAYGWLNARGEGKPLFDPLGKSIVEVHTYADGDAAGSSTEVMSTSVTRSRVKVVTDWARDNGLKVWVGEVGMYADAKNAKANWTDFLAYADENRDTLVGFAWWACGKPGWWDDIAANNGGHFAITPTSDYSTDTVNMKMIAEAFGK